MAHFVSVLSQNLVKKAALPIVNKIPSMVKSHIDLASYLVEDAFGSVRDISKNVVSHYYVAGSMQVCVCARALYVRSTQSHLFFQYNKTFELIVSDQAKNLLEETKSIRTPPLPSRF